MSEKLDPSEKLIHGVFRVRDPVEREEILARIAEKEAERRRSVPTDLDAPTEWGSVQEFKDYLDRQLDSSCEWRLARFESAVRSGFKFGKATGNVPLQKAAMAAFEICIGPDGDPQ